MGVRTRQPLVGVSLAAIGGICLSPILSSWGGIIGGLGMLVLWRLFHGTRWILLATVCLFSCLHNLQTVESQAALFSRFLPLGIWQGQGIVTQAFRPYYGTLLLIVQTEKLAVGNNQYHLSLRVLVPWKGEFPTVGSRVGWTGLIQQVAKDIFPPHSAPFHYQAWLSAQGVYLKFYQVVAHRIIHSPSLWHPSHWATAARKRIEQGITRGIESHKKESALIRALTLGADRKTEKMLAGAFRQTGTYHIFSVSGLHVGMVAAIAWQVCNISNIPQRLALPIIISLLFGYAWITGLRPPAFRAACMAGVLFCGTFVMRRAFVLNSLAAAALCMLCWNSRLLFQPGFQLSFVVVATIASLAPLLYRFGQRIFLPDPFLPRRLLTLSQRMFGRLGSAVVATLAVSIAAWLGSTPILLWHFQNASLSALLVNPLVVPLAFLVLSLAILSLLCDFFLSTWLATVFAHANLLPASAILAIVQWAANLPGGFLQWTIFTAAP